MKWYFGLLLLTILIGCRGIVEREDLGENDAPRAVTLVDLPDCRLCHGYPPVSGQHFRGSSSLRNSLILSAFP